MRTILSVLLIVGLLVPVAGASVPPASQSPDAGSPSTPTAAGGSDAGSASGSTEAANYTRLYVEDRYGHLRLKPGEEDSVTVTVVNADEESVTISPELVRANPRARPIDEAWVTMDVPTTTLDPEESVEVTVTVSVPEDAELGDYRTELAFTDESIAYPGQPARPVHATTLNVDVWKEPTVRVISGDRLYTQIEAGEGHVHQIVIENTGDEAVPLSPTFEDERRHHGPPGSAVDRSWFDIEAPNEIQPGETAVVNVTIEPPADAERGRYGTQLDLGIKDPARAEQDTYWQQVNLNFQVWTQPEEPYESTFEVSEEASNITLTLSPRNPRGSDDSDPVSFDVVFVSPDGSTVTAERVQVSNGGFVDLSGDRRGRSAQRGEDYVDRNSRQQFVYRVDEPVAGSWTVQIMPHNTVGFGYEIVRDESAD